MRVLITGATGLVGKELVKQCLNQDIQVHYLTTSKKKITLEKGYKGFYWNPANGEIDTTCFNEVDAIINLAGASISKRWTSNYKQEILESRIQSLNLLKETIKQGQYNVKHLISASAIGVYPDSLTNYYDETSKEKASGFLGDVVQQWEDAADQFSELNIKVAKIRIGLVLAEDGGALPKLVKPIALGFGAAFGSGKQWQSWIHVTDLVQLFLFVLKKNLSGVYNGVSPNPVSNKELVKVIAKQLHRPLIFPNIPKFVLELLLGEMHSLLFESQRVSSSKVENLGFNYAFHNAPNALKDLLS